MRLKYYKWLLNLIGEKDTILTKTLMRVVFESDHVYGFSEDQRAEDGYLLRYDFGEHYRYTDNQIRKGIDNAPVSFLEVMVALCKRLYDITCDSCDMTMADWFTVMIQSMRLDDEPVEDEIENACDIVMDRDYDDDGRGGLFWVPGSDLSVMNIWYQAHEWIAKNI